MFLCTYVCVDFCNVCMYVRTTYICMYVCIHVCMPWACLRVRVYIQYVNVRGHDAQRQELCSDAKGKCKQRQMIRKQRQMMCKQRQMMCNAKTNDVQRNQRQMMCNANRDKWCAEIDKGFTDLSYLVLHASLPQVCLSSNLYYREILFQTNSSLVSARIELVEIQPAFIWWGSCNLCHSERCLSFSLILLPFVYIPILQHTFSHKNAAKAGGKIKNRAFSLSAQSKEVGVSSSFTEGPQTLEDQGNLCHADVAYVARKPMSCRCNMSCRCCSMNASHPHLTSCVYVMSSCKMMRVCHVMCAYVMSFARMSCHVCVCDVMSCHVMMRVCHVMLHHHARWDEIDTWCKMWMSVRHVCHVASCAFVIWWSISMCLCHLTP